MRATRCCVPGPSGVWVARQNSRDPRLHAGVVRTARERREGGAQVDRRVERHEPAHERSPTVAVNDAVNRAPGRTVGWSPVTSAFVGAVIGSTQQNACGSGAYTWTNG